MSARPANILSIDIGHQYLAYALYEESQFFLATEPPQYHGSFDPRITYGIFRFTGTDCVHRCQSIVEFLSGVSFDHIIIEKQVGFNAKAMQVQYALVSAASLFSASIEIQSAITKFQVLNQPCDTRGKAHKLLSSQLALNWLAETFVSDHSEMRLSEYQKKDDIADAINMLRAFLITHAYHTPAVDIASSEPFLSDL
jgi:hypothetical protein